MLSPDRLLLEMLVVGLVLAGFGAIVDLVMSMGDTTPTMKAAVRAAVTGALFHMVCEVSGLNGTYCRSR
tara:strand:+ start:84 stop:290 length:207 start_codon:yes stop_codon:yes gene_type:complete